MKKETPPILQVEQQRGDASETARVADGELDETDESIQDAVTTDANGFPDMMIMDDVGDPDVDVMSCYRERNFWRRMF